MALPCWVLHMQGLPEPIRFPSGSPENPR
jgi:AraC-like DNA-binding protein